MLRAEAKKLSGGLRAGQQQAGVPISNISPVASSMIRSTVLSTV